jgi:hypothetical protein
MVIETFRDGDAVPVYHGFGIAALSQTGCAT